MNVTKIDQAKARLRLDNPYFAHLCSQLTIELSDDQESFVTNGETLYVNDDYLDSLSIEQTQFMLSNAAMHRVLDTKSRKEGKMQWLWQLASDYAINAMLVANDMPLPDRINYRKRFDGMYAEEIYTELKHDIMNEEYDDNEENDAGHNENNRQKQNEQKGDSNEKTNKQSQIESERHEQRLSLDLEKALSEAYKSDAVPKELERLLKHSNESKVQWQEALHGFVEELFVSDYQRFPPNKKFLHQGIILPTLVTTPKKLAIAIDSSASISQESLERFIAEVEAIRLSVENIEIELFVCDSKIHLQELFRYGEPLDVTIVGGGGTDFRPVFERIEHESEVAGLIYFTDAQGQFPQVVPDLPILWVLSKDAFVPFGEKIVL